MNTKVIIRGIKHDFPFINIRKVPREVLKTEGEAEVLWNTKAIIRGIKHDFPFINIRKVPREVLTTEGEARGFQPSRGTWRMLMNDKIIIAIVA